MCQKVGATLQEWVDSVDEVLGKRTAHWHTTLEELQEVCCVLSPSLLCMCMLRGFFVSSVTAYQRGRSSLCVSVPLCAVGEDFGLLHPCMTGEESVCSRAMMLFMFLSSV